MPKFDLSCSIVCSENSGRPACPDFSVTATDRTRKTRTIITIENVDADYPYPHEPTTLPVSEVNAPAKFAGL